MLKGSALKHWSRVKRYVAQDGCDRVSSGKADPRPALEGSLCPLLFPRFLTLYPFPSNGAIGHLFYFIFEKGWVILFSGLCAIDPLQSVSGKIETFFSYGINKKESHLIVVVVEKIENI